MGVGYLMRLVFLFPAGLACALTTVCLAQDHPEPLRLKAAFFMTSAPASTELPQAPPATHKDPAIAPLPSPPSLTLGEVLRRALAHFPEIQVTLARKEAAQAQVGQAGAELLPLGILLALGRRSHLPLVRWFCIGFIELWRGVPLLTALFMATIMLPLFLPDGVTLDRLLRAAIALTLFTSAYMAEVVRGGLQGVPYGQTEAARSLGLGFWRVQGLVVLPQALRLVVPAIVNTAIDLFKDTTLVLIVGLFDLLGMVNLALKDSASKALLHNLIQKMGDSIRNGDWRRGVLDIDTDVLTSFGDLKVTDVKTKILERLSALPEEDEVMAEVDRAEAQFADELKKIDRSPNSVKIFPSSGPAGNIDGTSFPKGTWALTFDDGPHASITSRDIENLKSAGVKATFFWLAKNLRPNLDVVREAISEGMPVANHSWTHAKLDSSADLERLKTNLDREIVLSTSEHTRVLGAAPLFFRCPYGAGFRDPKIRAMIAKLGMIHVRWNVDSLDWKDPDPESVQERVELQMKNNRAGIILFHDIQSPALKVVPNLLDKYRGKVRWVTIPQIVDELNGKARR